ncbi:type II secretion system protein [Acinetobacter pragensis]|uniref:Prepilin-type N-terminal cleavage/methylation domain-containing protein n=1 Tax=Acinetobacter pragensis TaxID=1806892 RepID=A0A151XYG5_9GAMM|nr:prepilin-type N-terminal cleavage/methylation domain-containing protein [Acinetobacter pragensis]KYQ70883.1 hypothetical protein AZH43_17025 [Acinetobacter pragensis]
MQKYSGFTLIELMIVVAILGVLIAIALPVYHHQAATASTKACMYEAKSYSNSVAYALYDQDYSTNPIAPVIKACETITDASGWTLDTMQKVIATAKLPSKAKIECNLPEGVPCKALP